MATQPFSDEEFSSVCEHLVGEPVIEAPWEFFTESHGVKIYRLYHEDSGLYEYRIYGVLEEVSPEICAQVYMDLDYRKQWDSYVKDLYEVEEGGKKGIYWQVNFPLFFFSNRDYIYYRELREIDHKDNHIWVCLARSGDFTSVPEVSGVIRVTDYKQSAALCSDGKGGTKAYMHYYDNPRGSIPTMLINWGAKTGVPSFLTNMQKACRGYPDYLKTKS